MGDFLDLANRSSSSHSPISAIVEIFIHQYLSTRNGKKTIRLCLPCLPIDGAADHVFTSSYLLRCPDDLYIKKTFFSFLICCFSSSVKCWSILPSKSSVTNYCYFRSMEWKNWDYLQYYFRYSAPATWKKSLFWLTQNKWCKYRGPSLKWTNRRRRGRGCPF